MIASQKISLTLGDGSVWELPYELSPFDEDFNYSKFDFLNTPGSLIDRKEVQATRYELIVYFLGVDQMTNSRIFRESTLDKRPWIVEHPFNGTRNMQPTSIKYDVQDLNTTVTIQLFETILSDGLLINQDPRSTIEAGAETLNEINDNTSAELIAGQPTEVVNLTDTANGINEDLRNKISAQDIADQYSDIFFQMNSYVGSFGSQPIQVMRQISNMLLMPRNFIDNINDRLEFVSSQFSAFFNLAGSLPTMYTAQYLGASVISAYSVTAIPTKSGDYSSALDVDKVAVNLWTMFEDYIENMQKQQAINGFVPDYEISKHVYEQVVFTIFNLYKVAMDLPTVVEITLTTEEMAVILAHKYGMDFEKMFKLNNWSIAQTGIISAGTQFKYYV